MCVSCPLGSAASSSLSTSSSPKYTAACADHFQQPIRGHSYSNEPIIEHTYTTERDRDQNYVDRPIKERKAVELIKPEGYFNQPMTADDYPDAPMRVEYDDEADAESYGKEHTYKSAADIERRYCDRFAGFRDDPYGGHWSSPTHSELEQLHTFDDR